MGAVTAQGVTGADGKWMVMLPPQSAGGPLMLKVQATDRETERRDILMGDVWLFSGQSNMAMGVLLAADGQAEAAKAANPAIRLFMAPNAIAAAPSSQVEGYWRLCSPAAVGSSTVGWGGFSAVAYYMGRRLYEELKVPIGLMQVAWMGTKICSWTSQEATRKAGLAVAPGLLPEFEVIPALTDPRMNLPSAAFNGMLAPLIPMAIKGIAWYQGESDTSIGLGYERWLVAMVTDWRARWGRPDLPFLVVQIHSHGEPSVEPLDNKLSELREAQANAVARLGHCGMVVTTDIGDRKNIHPKNKAEVGRRLALQALSLVYGRVTQATGPRLLRWATEGGVVRFAFDPATGPLKASELPLRGFQIAGADRRFVWAQAVLESETVVAVRSSSVADPKAVRYAWSAFPGATLTNAAGLPCAPFRTDAWPVLTSP
ncbi:MAG: sialate O-acetylesterase [Armatimonadetes bacterium]|nr:sialate O-acetylesterase [Armatimonadota bacterium]